MLLFSGALTRQRLDALVPASLLDRNLDTAHDDKSLKPRNPKAQYTDKDTQTEHRRNELRDQIDELTDQRDSLEGRLPAFQLIHQGIKDKAQQLREEGKDASHWEEQIEDSEAELRWMDSEIQPLNARIGVLQDELEGLGG